MYLSGVSFVVLHENIHAEISRSYGLPSVITYGNFGLTGLCTTSTLPCTIHLNCLNFWSDQMKFESSQVLVGVLWSIDSILVCIILLMFIWRREVKWIMRLI